MTNNKKQLIAWLNDAYAMERSLAQVLENHANDAKDYPEIQIRTETHLEETRRHAEWLERCLRVLGESASTTKGIMGSAMGKMQGVASGMFKDEVIKNLLADYSAEHMEIASYTALIAAAESLGEAEIVRICTDILNEEKTMADWLEQRIPSVTKSYLEKQTMAAST